jgi:O-antigen ligase
MTLRTRYRVRALVFAAVTAVAVYAVIPAEQKARLDSMGEDQTSVNRLDRWEDGVDIANEYPVLGIGYNNWGVYYHKYYNAGLSHNIFIQAWAELGYLGLGAFIALIIATFRVNWRTRRLARSLRERGRFLYFMAHGLDGALIGYMASGFFVTVLYYPFFWINLAMTVSLSVAAKHSARSARRTQPAPGQQRYRTPVAVRPRRGPTPQLTPT